MAALAVGALLGWLASGRLAPDAQAQDKPAAAGKPKMATEIPPAITTPDTLETHLGTLKFTDGFPDDATVLKDGPVVVESPPNTLGIVDDFWFRYVADLGNAGPDKGKGGEFLFLPPGYKGEVPEG